jgi:predicted ribosomally synthesized peptide with nif11-like leader
MSAAHVEGFYSKLAADPETQKKLKAALDAAAEEAIVSQAAGLGFAFTAEQLRVFMANKVSQLDDGELEKVAGGIMGPQNISQPMLTPERFGVGMVGMPGLDLRRLL